MSSVSSGSSPVVAPPGTAATEFVMRLRPTLAYVLLALALSTFLFGAYYTSEVVRTIQTNRKLDDKTKQAEGENQPQIQESLDDAKPSLVKPEQILAALGGFMFAVVFGGVGANLLFAMPPRELEDRRRDARRAMLLVGGLTGLVILTLGLSFFILYFGTLVTWLGEQDKPAPPQTWRLLTALLAMILGAGLSFLAAQPARADERNEPNTRRMIYGMNFALSTMLLVMLLLVANIIISLKVPNKLDTTAAGINSIELSEPTKEYLTSLTTPVLIYSTVDSNSEVALDIQRLLDAVRAQNPIQITVKTLSKTVNKTLLSELRAKYSQVDFSSDGLLVLVGEEQNQFSYITVNDMIDRQFSPQGDTTISFVGEQKLLKEILFLSENKTKPIVYFTVGHNELTVVPNPDPNAPQPPPGRTAAMLRTVLEKAYAELRPLSFDLTDPKVPEDCSVLVIADPRSPFSPAEVNAIRAYLQKPAKLGKPGRLILMSSPTPNPDKSGVLDLNLNEILLPFGIALDDRYIFNVPYQGLGFRETFASVGFPSQGTNLISKTFAADELNNGFIFPNARMVTLLPPSAGNFSSKPLMQTELGRINWLETTIPESPTRAFNELIASREIQAKKQVVQNRGRLVAAYVADDDQGQIVVFGSGEAFADPASRSTISDPKSAAELFLVALNYLRDQPEVANIAAKKYGEFSLTKNVNVLQIAVLPFSILTLTLIALGVGIWVVRRK